MNDTETRRTAGLARSIIVAMGVIDYYGLAFVPWQHYAIVVGVAVTTLTFFHAWSQVDG